MGTTNLDHQGRTKQWCYVCDEEHPFHGYDQASRERVINAEREAASKAAADAKRDAIAAAATRGKR